MSVFQSSAGPDIECDVCVIGGGPAGATAARALARFGHRVVLVEKSPHPNHKVGVSLPPSIVPLLDTLGLRERVEGASFIRPERVVNLWGGAAENVELPPGQSGFIVDRARFDQLLLEAAAEAGVKILQPARASRPDCDARGVWNLRVSCDAGTLGVRAGFLVDAAGRGRALRGARRRYSAPTLALNGYWREASFCGSSVMIEAGPDEWFWGAPLPDGTFNVMVFLDPDRCRAWAGRGADSLYHSLLDGSALFSRRGGGRLSGRASCCDASSYAAERPVGEGWIKVGEASFTIDPLSSQGVQAAISSALQGSVVVNTHLKSPADAEAARRFYTDRQQEAIARHGRFAARHYADARPRHAGEFWHKRAAVEPERRREGPEADTHALGTMRLRLSGEATLVPTPCVTGDVIRNVRALMHPRLERPVAYVNGVEVSPLLECLPAEGTVAEVVRAWARHISPREGLDLLKWLYREGVLVNARH